MNNFWEGIRPFITPISIIIGFVIIGFIFKKVIITILIKLAKKTTWKVDNIIISAIKNSVILWCFILGVYLALPSFYYFWNENIISIIQKILTVIIIFSITLVLAKIAAGFAVQYGHKTGSRFTSTTIFKNITKVFVLVIGFLIILQALKISITPILTALGVGGLAVALALQDTLSNLFSGFQILAAGQIKKGDYIELSSGEAGYITDINWRNTTIEDIRKNAIVIPNSTISSVIVKNFHLPNKEMSIPVDVGVGYNSDLEKVEKITLEEAKKIMQKLEGGSSQLEPLVRYRSFGESSINFFVILFVTEYKNKFIVRHEFIKRLHKRYNKEGIVIPFPIRTIEINKNQ